MATEIEPSCYVEDSSESEHPNLKRKLSPSRSPEDSPTELNIGETSEAEFEKSDLPDFSEFTVENGTIKLERNLDENPENFDAFHQTYPGYLESISMTQPCDRSSGDNISDNINECSPSKKVVQGNGFQPLKTQLMSHAVSPSFNSQNSENSTSQSNPVPAHFISATGDSHSGWYEVLEVNENGNMYPNSSIQLKDPRIIKTLDKSSSIHVHQPTNTPISTQPYLRTVPPSGFVYTPHPRSGQVLYITDTSTVNPDGIQSKVPTVSPLLMNGTNMLTPEAVAKIHPKILFSTCDDNKTAEQGNTENQSLKTSLKEVQPKENSSMSILDSPEAVDEERESHNMKERKRRARIKEACDLMRQLVPGMSDKTDKATVFEFAARYIYFLKNFVGNAHDKDFLIKYSPY